MAELQKTGMPYFIFAFLGIVKILGAAGLLIVKWSVLREWIYAGFVYLLVGAIWLHIATNTSPVTAIISLIVLVMSYVCWRKVTHTEK